MKSIRKMLLGIVVIGGMIFVGCESEDASKDATIESTVEEEEAKTMLDVYGDECYNFTIGDTDLLIASYLSTEEFNHVNAGRYEQVKKLTKEQVEEHLDAIVEYLKNPNEPSELTFLDDEKKSSNTQPNNNEGSNDNQSGNIYIQNHQPMKNGKPVIISRVVEPPANSDWGDIPDNYLYLRCISCDEPFLTNDLSKERCPECEQYVNHPASHVEIYCDVCGQQAVDPDTGICRNCGNDYYSDVRE